MMFEMVPRGGWSSQCLVMAKENPLAVESVMASSENKFSAARLKPLPLRQAKDEEVSQQNSPAMFENPQMNVDPLSKGGVGPSTPPPSAPHTQPKPENKPLGEDVDFGWIAHGPQSMSFKKDHFWTSSGEKFDPLKPRCPRSRPPPPARFVCRLLMEQHALPLWAVEQQSGPEPCSSGESSAPAHGAPPSAKAAALPRAGPADAPGRVPEANGVPARVGQFDIKRAYGVSGGGFRCSARP